MVEPSASRLATAIHMLFMLFPIAAVWLDDSFVVVDKKLAKPWRLIYIPAKPARYTLEAAPDILRLIDIGDRLEFELYS